MALTKYRLGELIKPYSRKCGVPDLMPDQVSGVNREKEFFEPSHQVGEDTSKYQIVPPLHFACNLMHVGRDKVLPIAYNHSEHNKIVSPAYVVFSLKDNVGVLAEYFFLMLKSNERDRFFWFHADSSVRDGMPWEAFCDVEINVPNIETQQKYVDVYKAMVANQKSYERGLEDLKESIDALLDKVKHTSKTRPVGELLQEVDYRNENGELTDVQGINIDKHFMPTVADTNGVNLRNYKVVKKGLFAYSGMQTGRDERIRIALYDGSEPIIISPAYSVFEAKDKTVLAEYIMVWFSRAESDRRGWFMSDSSIRTNLDLDRFYEIKIPVPDMKLQESIVDMYSSYVARSSISATLKSQIKDICPILIKGSLEEGRTEEVVP